MVYKIKIKKNYYIHTAHIMLYSLQYHIILLLGDNYHQTTFNSKGTSKAIQIVLNKCWYKSACLLGNICNWKDRQNGSRINLPLGTS